MHHVLIVDDVQSIKQACHLEWVAKLEGGLDPAETFFCLVRCQEDACDVVEASPPFDTWYMDYSLDGSTGLDFMKWVAENCPDKWPALLIPISGSAQNCDKMREFDEEFRARR